MNTFEIEGIARAQGLQPEERSILRELLDVANGVEARNGILDRYYESEHETASIGIDNIPDEVDPGLHVDWARKAVTSVSERVRMDGFTFAGDYSDPALDRIVLENDLSNAFNRTVCDELKHGCMFATVQRSGSSATVRMHSAETAAAMMTALTIAATRNSSSAISMEAPRRSCSFCASRFIAAPPLILILD